MFLLRQTDGLALLFQEKCSSFVLQKVLRRDCQKNRRSILRQKFLDRIFLMLKGQRLFRFLKFRLSSTIMPDLCVLESELIQRHFENLRLRSVRLFLKKFFLHKTMQKKHILYLETVQGFQKKLHQKNYRLSRKAGLFLRRLKSAA